MAKNYDRVACWGAMYCGDFCDHWNGNFSDPTWERNGKDSGKIKFTISGYHAWRNVRWISPGQGTWVSVEINGTNYAESGHGTTYDDCGGGDAMGATASGTAELIQTSANPYGHLTFDIRRTRSNGSTSFSTHEDLGEWPWEMDLTDNFKILPPTGLSGSVTSASPRKIKSTCTIGSWSANNNIKGTPYTGDGGRNWNFRAQIIYNGSVIDEKTTNTGENKTATFEFNDVSRLDNLPLDTNITMHFTCSNDYQQTIDYDVTFQLEAIGWVVTTASAKKIRYIGVFEDRGDSVVTSYNSGLPGEY